jgi:ABC-type nitrate/sulfonate/bicarbonate transport system permease component
LGVAANGSAQGKHPLLHHRPKLRRSRGVDGFRGSFLLQLGSILGGLIVWETVARIWEPSFLPPATSVAQRLWEMTVDGEIWVHLSGSLANLAIGFLISLVAGLAIGILMGRYPFIEAALDVYVYAMLTAPVLVFAPIFFAIFGLGRGAIVGVVVMYAIFVMIINTTDGIKATPKDLLEMAKSFNATGWQTVRFVVLPAAGPMIMAGVRLGSGRAVKGMINGEMFIAVVGLGGLVRRAGQVFDSVTVLAIVALIVMVALLLSAVVQWVDRRITHWLPSRSHS